MSVIQLYVHSRKDAEPSLIEVEEEILVSELVTKIIEAGFCDGAPEEVLIFVEDGVDPIDHGHHAKDHGIHHRHHVHCHKCRQIRVGVVYNGVEKDTTFSPATKVKRVLKWAVDAFGLKGVDVENKVLMLPGTKTELSNDAHLGSYVQAPECGVKLFLVAPIRFQG
jgi:hypothetical protein